MCWGGTCSNIRCVQWGSNSQLSHQWFRETILITITPCRSSSFKDIMRYKTLQIKLTSRKFVWKMSLKILLRETHETKSNPAFFFFLLIPVFSCLYFSLFFFFFSIFFLVKKMSKIYLTKWFKIFFFWLILTVKQFLFTFFNWLKHVE